MGIKEGLLLWFIFFFDKKSASLTDKSVTGGGVANNEIKQNLLKNYANPLLKNL